MLEKCRQKEKAGKKKTTLQIFLLAELDFREF